MIEKSPYKSLSEWREINPHLFMRAYRKGWLDDLCDNFGWVRFKQRKKWTFENVFNDALKFPTKTKWVENGYHSYVAAQRYGWIDECSKHMVLLKKPNSYWTKERCIVDALLYPTKSEWRKNSSAYTKAKRNGWFDECTEHMKILGRKQKPAGFWNIKKNVFSEVEKHPTIANWKEKSFGSYQSATRNNWLEEILNLYGWALSKPPITENECFKSALKYERRGEWLENDPSYYYAAKKLKCYDKCTKHMTRTHK